MKKLMTILLTLSLTIVPCTVSAKNGDVVGKIYSTDILADVNGRPVPSYNIGGKTALCIEDLGKVVEGESNYEYGYSKYLCNAVWNEKTRNISLNTFVS